jgi:hypothetical protein
MNSRRLHLVGAQQDCRRKLDADRLGGLQVDYQLELRGLLDRQVGGLRTLENLRDVLGCPYRPATAASLPRPRLPRLMGRQVSLILPITFEPFDRLRRQIVGEPFPGD